MTLNAHTSCSKCVELKETSKTVRARDSTRYRSSRPSPNSARLSRRAPAPGLRRHCGARWRRYPCRRQRQCPPLRRSSSSNQRCPCRCVLKARLVLHTVASALPTLSDSGGTSPLKFRNVLRSCWLELRELRVPCEAFDSSLPSPVSSLLANFAA